MSVVNPYEKWAGYGRVAGREQVFELGPNYEELPERPVLPPSTTDYEQLHAYLPKPDENRPMYVLRVVPEVTDPAQAHVKIIPAGMHWNHDTVKALQSLTFTYVKDSNDSQVLVSQADVSLTAGNWISHGKVEIRERFKQNDNFIKLFSKVMFEHRFTKKKAAVFWCWNW